MFTKKGKHVVGISFVYFIYIELVNSPNNSISLGLTSSSSVWIGAWWIGFVIAAIMCVAIAIPILAFPPLMPGAIELQKHKESEAHGEDESATSVAFTKIRELPKALKALLVNPTFFFLNMAGASEGLLVSGFAAFLPKLIENQFSVTASWAALIMGNNSFRKSFLDRYSNHEYVV